MLKLLNCEQICYGYDVSTQPVSVHLALSRLISALLLALPKQRLKWDRSEVDTLLQLMEAPLRLQVLKSYVCLPRDMSLHAEDSLIKQLYLYNQNVRCRTEIFDRDVVLLQLCAAFFNSPDRFLLACLHRFNLLEWAKEDFDSSSRSLVNDKVGLRKTILIAEEFFRLLIILSQERHTPGIGQVVFLYPKSV